jgi:hydrogenase maturation protease
MLKSPPRILIYGIGNPGRQDDALGILLAQEMEIWAQEKKFSNIVVDQNYQLNIEDSEKITHYDIIIFADASIDKKRNFSFSEIEPDLIADFTMHSVRPSFIVGLSAKIFESRPKSFLLQIRGYKWELIENISPKARLNLEASIEFLKLLVKDKYL